MGILAAPASSAAPRAVYLAPGEYTGGTVVPRKGGGASCTAPGVYSRRAK